MAASAGRAGRGGAAKPAGSGTSTNRGGMPTAPVFFPWNESAAKGAWAKGDTHLHSRWRQHRHRRRRHVLGLAAGAPVAALTLPLPPARGRRSSQGVYTAPKRNKRAVILTLVGSLQSAGPEGAAASAASAAAAARQVAARESHERLRRRRRHQRPARRCTHPPTASRAIMSRCCSPLSSGTWGRLFGFRAKDSRQACMSRK